MRIIGLDAAWGERNPDGICFLENKHLIKTHCLPTSETLQEILKFSPAQIAIDAPVIVPNKTGSRPVDRMITSTFYHQKIACYPGNQSNCTRIIQLVKNLKKSGYSPSLTSKNKSIIEVYPHLSIVNFFQLPERLPYKKGTVAEKRTVFRKLQQLLLNYLTRHQFTLAPQVKAILQSRWTKSIEDQTDAILCAITSHHHLTQSQNSTQLGDLQSGFIVFPRLPHSI